MILSGDRVVDKQRDNDKFIMEVTEEMSFNVQKIQQVRLWLRVTTFVDIRSEDGKFIPRE